MINLTFEFVTPLLNGLPTFREQLQCQYICMCSWRASAVNNRKVLLNAVKASSGQTIAILENLVKYYTVRGKHEVSLFDCGWDMAILLQVDWTKCQLTY